MPVDIITIYDGPDACQQCLGWKRIDDGSEGTSWKHWAELSAPANLAVQLGVVKPIECPRCAGTGREPNAGERPVMQSARCAWEVTAGVIPGRPEQAYTRRWGITSAEWYGDDGRPSPQAAALFAQRMGKAYDYAKAISNPAQVNWVRVDFIWF